MWWLFFAVRVRCVLSVGLDGWPSSVVVFSGSDDPKEVSSVVKAAHSSTGQFSDERICFLFLPGTYRNVSVPVGYYTQVVGVGKVPSDVRFVGRGVSSPEEEGSHTALDSFWRSAEGFETVDGALLWAASQASPLRRVVAQDVSLSKSPDFSSGGFMSDSDAARVDAGTQQQYAFVDSNVTDLLNGAWNMVGINTDLQESCTTHRAVISVDAERRTPKPSLVYHKEDGSFALDGERDFVVVANSSSLLSAVTKENVVVVAPGIYEIDTLTLSKSESSLFGLGLATLRGNIVVSGDSVKIAGIIVEANELGGILVRWDGNDGRAWDLFVRVGEFSSLRKPPGQVDSMLEIRGDRFVGDDVWLWRADHDIYGQVYDSKNFVRDGLRVSGDDAAFFGLAVEHATRYQTFWTGDGGTVYFYQAELPYDAPPSFNASGYYVTGERHRAYGVGVYSYFRDSPNISLPSAISVSPGTFLHSPFAVWLDGQPSTVIQHVVNELGGPVGALNTVQHICGPLQIPFNDEEDDDRHRDEDDSSSPRPIRMAVFLRVMISALAVAALAGVGLTLYITRSSWRSSSSSSLPDRPPPHPRHRVSGEQDPAYELTTSLLVTGGGPTTPVVVPPLGPDDENERKMMLALVVCLGIDYGLKRVGVSVGAGFASRPLKIVDHSEKNIREVGNELLEMAMAERADAFVVGLPLDRDGSESDQSKLTRGFALELARHRDVFLWDERFSTKEAEAIMMMTNVAQGLDAVAASAILDDFFQNDGLARAERIPKTTTTTTPPRAVRPGISSGTTDEKRKTKASPASAKKRLLNERSRE